MNKHTPVGRGDLTPPRNLLPRGKNMSNKFWTSESTPILRAIDAGQSPVLVSGVGAASRAHVAAALRKELGFPLFVICPDEQSADIFRRDLEALLGEVSLLLPGREMNFYPADSASRSAEQARLAALDKLCSGDVPITVCCLSALLQRAIPPETLRSCALTIEDGAEISMEAVEAALLKNGYVHRMQVEAPGQYSRRGGILDFFSPAYANPVRM